MSHWNPVSWAEDAEDIAKDLADATTAVVTSVADELVDTGNTLVSTGHTVCNDIADGAVATFNTVSGGVVYAVDWTETEASEISTYAVSATGDIGDFSVEAYGKAKSWADTAWKYISSALMSSPPPLGAYNSKARDFMKAMLFTYVFSLDLAESIVSSWERDARKKGYTMAIDFDGGVQLLVVSSDIIGGVYVDSAGNWGYLAGSYTSVTLDLSLSASITRDIYMIFGDASAYDESYYFIGATLDVEGFIVGADAILSSNFKFKGFKATMGFGIEYELFSSGGSQTAKSESAKSESVEAGPTLSSFDIYSVNFLGEHAATTSVACDVATSTSDETSITANASAAMTLKSTSIVVSDQVGGTGGAAFSDDITNVERIKSITLRGGTKVDAISFTYVLFDGSTVVKSHGGTGGSATTLTLSDDEYITMVTGRSNTLLNQITFYTSYGRTISVGGTSGTTFTIDPKLNRPVIGMFGRSGTLIDAIGFYLRSGHPFIIQPKSSGLYLDVTGQMSAESGASTIQQTSTGGPNQRWLLSPGPEANQYYIVNAHTGLYLEAESVTGASIVQNTASGALNQLWGVFAFDTDGSYAIVNQATPTSLVTLFMDVKAGSAEAGAEVIVSAGTNETNQRWRITPAPTKVYAFSSGGFTGSFQVFGPGKYNMADLTIGNDAIRSLRVPEGWRVTLYADADFGGSTQVLTRDASELASMSGEVSSLVIEMPPWGATLYTNSAYGGTSLTLMPGKYSSLSSLGYENDGVSSVEVPSGWRVTLFNDEEFLGDMTVLMSSASDLKSVGVNDTASSVVVESSPLGQVVLYEDYQYQGASQVLAPGRHDVSVLKAAGCVGNDKVSAIKVPTNWTVTLYEHEKFGGSSKTLTADCAILDDFNDKTSSVVVIPG